MSAYSDIISDGGADPRRCCMATATQRKTYEPVVARVAQLAHDARRDYYNELAAGGEPVFPKWVVDVEAVVCLARVALAK